MAKNGRFTLWLLALLLTVAGSASAFDGKRTGFCLGFDAGLGTIKYVDVKYIDDGTRDHYQTLSGFQTTLDIGVGISDRLLILYSGHTTIYKTEDYKTLLLFTPTVILRYYFKPTARSFYLFGGPAVAGGIVWGDPDTGVGRGVPV